MTDNNKPKKKLPVSTLKSASFHQVGADGSVTHQSYGETSQIMDLDKAQMSNVLLMNNAAAHITEDILMVDTGGSSGSQQTNSPSGGALTNVAMFKNGAFKTKGLTFKTGDSVLVESEKKTELTAPPVDWTYFLQSASFSDITLSVSGHEFKAHRIILAGKSPIFKTVFEKNKNISVHSITDISPELFGQVLGYIYSGKCKPQSVDNGKELLIAARKFMLSHLKTQCEDFLLAKLTVENAADLAVFGFENGSPKLQEKATELI